MKKNNVSVIAVIVTLIFHWCLYFVATTRFPHHHTRLASDDIVRVSIPISGNIDPENQKAPDLTDLITPPEQLISPTDTEQDTDKDRYYQQPELSLKTQVLSDTSKNLAIPIRHVVVMSLYINEAGRVDDITLDDTGGLTEAEQKTVITEFKKMLFMPGMLGGKVVKSLYRIQLEVNQAAIVRY